MAGLRSGPITAPQRYGYDVDEAAIRAAPFLHRKKFIFMHGDLTTGSMPQIDVLILVNWIHEISRQVLEALMAPLLARTRYLPLIAIDREEPIGYRYKHEFTLPDEKARRVSITRPPDEGRSFQLFEVVA